jgi:hypothetical protein
VRSLSRVSVLSSCLMRVWQTDDVKNAAECRARYAESALTSDGRVKRRYMWNILLTMVGRGQQRHFVYHRVTYHFWGWVLHLLHGTLLCSIDLSAQRFDGLLACRLGALSLCRLI